MPHINFTKMHNLGNDFIIINNVDKNILLSTQLIKKLCDRHIGIGGDQLIMLEPSRLADFYYRIYNNDGSSAVSCGNGALCLARYIEENKLVDKHQVHLELINSNILALDKYDNTMYTVNFTSPSQDVQDIGLNLPDTRLRYTEVVDTLTFGALSVGNPHCLIVLDHQDSSYLYTNEAELLKMANMILDSKLFIHGVNISFIVLDDVNSISIRTFERGVNQFTNSCGTGAIASSYYCYLSGAIHSKEIQVNMRYGSVIVQIHAEGIKLLGTPSLSFQGTANV